MFNFFQVLYCFITSSQVLPTECRRKSQPWPQAPWRSRSSLHQRENTPYGSVVPSWLHCPPSNRCGFPSKNTTNLDHPSYTGSASKLVVCFVARIRTVLVVSGDQVACHTYCCKATTGWPQQWLQALLVWLLAKRKVRKTWLSSFNIAHFFAS